jgi:photosystem II stability/assembly factor-like uncharacterized protein
MRKLILLIVLFAFCSLNSDAQWRKLINDQTFDMWQNPLNPATMIVGGAGRVVYKTYDYGEHWDTLVVGPFRGGTARFNNIFINPIDTNIYITGGLVFGDIRCSTDGGLNWERVLYNDNGIALNGKSLEMQPDNPNNIYLGDWNTGIMYKSTNRGLNWDSISICTRTIQVNKKDTIVGVKFGCLTIRRDSCNIILLGTTSGELYMSNDYGVTWTFRQQLKKPKEDAEDCEITRIEFSDRNPLVGYGVITYLFSGNTPSGGVHKTTDGGYSWNNIAYPDTSFWAVCARTNEKGDDDEVFIGGYTENYYEYDSARVVGIGLVKRTTDGGKSWYSYDERMDWTVEHPKDDDLYDVFYLDSIYAYYCGERGHIKFSQTYGKSWNWCYPNATQNFYGIYFKTPDIGFSVGDGGLIVRTTDMGQKWTKYFIPEKTKLNTITASINKEIFVGGDFGKGYSTTNEGNTWVAVDYKTTENIKKIIFEKNTGVVIGANKSVSFSTDAGKNWKLSDATVMKSGEGLISIAFKSDVSKFYALSTLNNLYSIDLTGKVELFKENLYSKKLLSLSIFKNNIFFSGDSGTILFSNNTGYQRVNSALNNAHVRDNLSTIERDIEKILFNFLFDFNDEITRLRVRTVVENYLDAVVSARGLSTYSVVFDSSNNTNEVISANTAIIDIKVDFPRGIHKFINRITITRVGGELSSESSGFIPSF